MTNILKDKCECGSTEFIILETTSHKASLENGKLFLSNEEPNGFEDKVECANCHKEYSTSGLEIEY